MRVHFRPGQQLKTFEVYKPQSGADSKGRIKSNLANAYAFDLRAPITQAKQKEIEQYKQQGHPITHTVKATGHPDVSASDVLKLGDRKFYVENTTDPSELGFELWIWCEERKGV